MRAYVAELLEAHLAGAEPDRAHVKRLLADITRWVADDDEIKLHQVLGIGTQSKARLALRNRLLRKAAEKIEGCPSHKAAELARACRDFEVRLWRIWGHEQAPPARAGDVQRALWEAKRLGVDLPTTARQILNVLAV